MTTAAPQKRRLSLPQPQVEGLVSTLKALSDETRLKILALLGWGELCVCELVDILAIPQNLLSHHLAILRERDLVRARRHPYDARWAFYSLDPEAMSRLIADLTHLFQMSQPEASQTGSRDAGSEEGGLSGTTC